MVVDPWARRAYAVDSSPTVRHDLLATCVAVGLSADLTMLPCPSSQSSAYYQSDQID